MLDNLPLLGEKVLDDAALMALTLEMAARGAPLAFPNPLVGACLLTEHGRIFCDYHRKYGESHAEVNVLQQVLPNLTERHFNKLKGATLYVNFEPCSIYNNTPPCAELVAKLPLKRVVIGDLDPNPKILGEGIEILRKSGIEVEVGVLSNKNRILNRRFFTFHQKKRPYVILKWAESANGYLNDADEPASSWFTSEESRERVHHLRGSEMAILVGVNTVILDNPRLNVRYGGLPNPIKIVLDPQIRADYQDFRLSDEGRLVIFNCQFHGIKGRIEYVQLPRDGFLQNVMNACHSLKIGSILVEGGKFTLESFLRAGIYDEVYRFISEKRFSRGLAIDRSLIDEMKRSCRNLECSDSGGDCLYRYH